MGACSDAAKGFSRSNVDLLAWVSLPDVAATLPGGLGGAAADGLTAGLDLWGYTAAASGKEFALFTHTRGLSVVDVSTPAAPVIVSTVLSTAASWRDVSSGCTPCRSSSTVLLPQCHDALTAACMRDL